MFIQLLLLLLEHFGVLPESFLELEGFDATVGRPKQEQGPGKSQADGADQASSSQTVAEYITATAVVEAIIPLVKLEKCSVNFE